MKTLLARLLPRRPQPSLQGSDRRRHARFRDGRPLRLLTSERQLVAGRIADISMGGVRVYTQQPLRHGAWAREIRIENRAIPVRQVRVEAGPDCLAYVLAFEGFSPRDCEFLQGFIGQAGGLSPGSLLTGQQPPGPAC